MADPATDKAASHLLDFIAGFESGGNYSAYYSAAHNTTNFAAMTLDQVASFQWALLHARHLPSDALGRYQIISPTLQTLKRTLKLTGRELFTNAFQDKLGIDLLNSRGYTTWLNGNLGADGFADNLAHEWASLPIKNGRSAYAGDGLNKALVARAKVMGVLAETLAIHKGK